MLKNYIVRYSQVYYENSKVTVDVVTAAATVANFQKQMMNRLIPKNEPACRVICMKNKLFNCWNNILIMNMSLITIELQHNWKQ